MTSCLDVLHDFVTTCKCLLADVASDTSFTTILIIITFRPLFVLFAFLAGVLSRLVVINLCCCGYFSFRLLIIIGCSLSAASALLSLLILSFLFVVIPVQVIIVESEQLFFLSLSLGFFI